MLQKIQRVNLTAGTETAVEFANECGKYLVKNFGTGDLFVSFDEDFDESNSTKIPEGYYQIVVANEWLDIEAFKVKKIYLKGEGEVEVQQLCYQ